MAPLREGFACAPGMLSTLTHLHEGHSDKSASDPYKAGQGQRWGWTEGGAGGGAGPGPSLEALCSAPALVWHSTGQVLAIPL